MPTRPYPAISIAILAAVATVVAAVGIQSAAGAANATGSLAASTRFYSDPGSAVKNWVAANSSDSREPAIASRIAGVPQGIWFSRYSPSTVTNDVRAIASAATVAGTVPVLVVYEIPNRDCGGASAGGAPDIASYDAYMNAFAAGLGAGQVVVILEPDSLALQACLSAQQISDRDGALAFAGTAIHRADPAAKVYLDAGHSSWNSPSDQASRLAAAKAGSSSDGIFSNVSNFMTTAAEVSYDKEVLAALGNLSNLHIVVDTSRNGNGPASGNPWCDPSGRAVGTDSTASAGPTTHPTTPPSTPPTPTTPPTTSAAPGSCKVVYALQSAWAGGFAANVTITNTGAATMNGWSMVFTFPGDQRVTGFWNTALVQSGSKVTATSLSYNGQLSPGANTSFGFQGTWAASDAAPTAFAVNGVSCS
jgi:endoglucanase